MANVFLTSVKNGFEYIISIFEDVQGNPSSKRWFAFVILIFLLIFVNKVINHVFREGLLSGNIPEIGTNVAFIIAVAIFALFLAFLVLMGYASFAEKVLNMTTGIKGFRQRKTEKQQIPNEFE